MKKVDLRMIEIDAAAEAFYYSDAFTVRKDVKYFERFVQHASPIIRMIARTTSAKIGKASWHEDEIYSILLADMWRLFNCAGWVPSKTKKFHWLMLRQLKNKSSNYMQKVFGNPKHCPYCKAKYSAIRGIDGNTECGTCHHELISACNEKITSVFIENIMGSTPNYVKQIEAAQIVQKLFKAIQTDKKTCRILHMLLEGNSKTMISRTIQIAPNALQFRLEKCKKIVQSLVNTCI